MKTKEEYIFSFAGESKNYFNTLLQYKNRDNNQLCET